MTGAVRKRQAAVALFALFVASCGQDRGERRFDLICEGTFDRLDYPAVEAGPAKASSGTFKSTFRVDLDARRLCEVGAGSFDPGFCARLGLSDASALTYRCDRGRWVCPPLAASTAEPQVEFDSLRYVFETGAFTRIREREVGDPASHPYKVFAAGACRRQLAKGPPRP